MNIHGNQIKLFAGNASPKLAQDIADQLGMPLCKIEVGKFSDGECFVQILESVRGSDVFVIQSTSSPVNDNLMELLIMIDALKRASAGRITAVIPYFGYARQDRKARPRDPITARLVADILEKAGADRILTMDLHANQIQGFFSIPVDHLIGIPILGDVIKTQPFFKAAMEKDELITVSPDVGSVTRARRMAEKLGTPLAIVDKRRPKANVMEVMNIVGDVHGKVCLLVDDMIDTAGTIVEGARALVEVGGATKVYACCTHGVLSGPAVERLEKSYIEKLFMLDTIQQPDNFKLSKLVPISVAPIFAKGIKSVFSGTPFSIIYDKKQ